MLFSPALAPRLNRPQYTLSGLLGPPLVLLVFFFFFQSGLHMRFFFLKARTLERP